jgi:16S rRNA (guanine(966)-N(2))-methyltransferase RsmD
MRVIAGRAKGHRLRLPRSPETRPTSGKVREAIFAILGDTFVDGAVLDLFAGTGALGIEALSRGASYAVFVESRRSVCQIIRANLVHTDLEAEARVLCISVERSLGMLLEPFDLIMLDPPYGYPALHDIMAMLSGAKVVKEDTVVVFEHSPRFAVEERYGSLVLRRHKVYGDTAVSIFVVQRGESA